MIRQRCMLEAMIVFLGVTQFVGVGNNEDKRDLVIPGGLHCEP